MKHHMTLKDLLARQKAAHEEMPKLNLEPIHKLFEGTSVPHIDESPVGRIRLIRLLRNKYGMNYRAYPEASHAINHYDNEVEHLRIIKHVLGAKHGV